MTTRLNVGGTPGHPVIIKWLMKHSAIGKCLETLTLTCGGYQGH